MKIDDFKKHSHELVDWMCKYLENVEKYPVKSNVKPGEIYNSLPKNLHLKVNLLIKYLKILMKK